MGSLRFRVVGFRAEGFYQLLIWARASRTENMGNDMKAARPLTAACFSKVASPYREANPKP